MRRQQRPGVDRLGPVVTSEVTELVLVVLHCELIRSFEFPRTCSASRRRIRSRECEGDTMRWATKQRNLRCRASREIRAEVKIDGEAGTGHHLA
jgi:hypothetical protein